MFKSGLSLETNNASLIKSLKRLDSYVKIEKSSNEPTLLENKQWSLTADFLLFLKRLPVKADRLKCSSVVVLKSIFLNLGVGIQKILIKQLLKALDLLFGFEIGTVFLMVGRE